MNPVVAIRRATAADAGFLLGVRAEPSASRFQPLRAYSLDGLRAVLQQRAHDPLDRAFGAKVHWVSTCDGTPAGWITLDVTSRSHGIATVGYTVSEAFRRRGVASGALRSVIAVAFDADFLNLARLEAVAAIGNVASRRVLVKAGFSEEGSAEKLLIIDGVRVDHVRFGLVRPEGVSERCPC